MTLTAIKYIKALSALDMPVDVVEGALDIYQSSPELKTVLECPVVYHEQKYAAIDRIFPEKIRNLLKLLCLYSDMEYFEEIASSYRAYINEHQNRLNASLRYVTPPDGQQLNQIKDFLCRKYGVSDVVLDQTEDKSLIGGFILSANGSEYDWSLRGRMEGLRNILTGGEADGRN